jgi:hypothetical protein
MEGVGLVSRSHHKRKQLSSPKFSPSPSKRSKTADDSVKQVLEDYEDELTCPMYVSISIRIMKHFVIFFGSCCDLLYVVHNSKTQVLICI